ncbi:hypothetical protein NM208_g17141 [Fusarium decemcellulare]|uniref:Uncharacterized protein n=1 Tax=Fusarium decemcellulare TaxID=57161 RepID=A0ACC1R879_9HYPO|nr:hypothetical protein NM208_g17141 [Fusarium decemcellulare]
MARVRGRGAADQHSSEFRDFENSLKYRKMKTECPTYSTRYTILSIFEEDSDAESVSETRTKEGRAADNLLRLLQEHDKLVDKCSRNIAEVARDEIEATELRLLIAFEM